MPSFTVECEYPMLFRSIVTVEASNPIEACCTAIDEANQSDAWEGIDCEQPTWITSLAEGDDVSTWKLTEKGFDTSVLPVPPAFTDIARLAGYAATRTDDLIKQLRALIDAIGEGSVDTSEIMRLRTAGQSLLDDITWRSAAGNPVSTAQLEQAA